MLEREAEVLISMKHMQMTNEVEHAFSKLELSWHNRSELELTSPAIQPNQESAYCTD